MAPAWTGAARLLSPDQGQLPAAGPAGEAEAQGGQGEQAEGGGQVAPVAALAVAALAVAALAVAALDCAMAPVSPTVSTSVWR